MKNVQTNEKGITLVFKELSNRVLIKKGEIYALSWKFDDKGTKTTWIL